MERFLIILQGLPILFLAHDGVAIVFYFLRGLPFWLVTALISIKWILGMILLFYATSWLVKWLKKSFFVEKIKSKIPEWLKSSLGQERSQKRLISWVLKRKNWIVILLSFVPYSNLLGIASIVAVRTLKIKYGFLILLVATVFKALVFCFTLYSVINP